jgi:CRP-like cAMP-binding protein
LKQVSRDVPRYPASFDNLAVWLVQLLYAARTALTCNSSVLEPFLSKLEGYANLSASDRTAILSLPYNMRTFDAGRYVFREGERASNCCVILSGFACTHKIVADGARQILSMHMRTDGVDLQNALLASNDHNIQALTNLEVAVIPAAMVSELISAHPGAARALWVETLLHASIQREWIANVGRRNARTRIAHLLCELGLRMEHCGLGRRGEYELPVTQEQLADATGLTSVHVNRVLQGLRSDQIIRRGGRMIAARQWSELVEAGDFRSSYLQPCGA